MGLVGSAEKDVPDIDRVRNLGGIHDPGGIEHIVVVLVHRGCAGGVAEHECVDVRIHNVQLTVLVPTLIKRLL